MAISAMAEVGYCQMIQGSSYSGFRAAATVVFSMLSEGDIDRFKGGRKQSRWQESNKVER